VVASTMTLPPSTSSSWREACRDQRTRAHAVRLAVQEATAWGPQNAFLANVRTGKLFPINFWLSADIGALCLFCQTEKQVRVLRCCQMASCELADDNQSDLAAKLFFLGLQKEDLQRAVHIRMSGTSHRVKIQHQGHASSQAVQLLLICSDPGQPQVLTMALNALASGELSLHEAAGGGFESQRDVAEAAAEETMPYGVAMLPLWEGTAVPHEGPFTLDSPALSGDVTPPQDAIGEVSTSAESVSEVPL